jgi:type II secretory pathway predicted ATPase ExeA
MVRDPLQLAAAALDGGLDPATFHTGPAQEEALARLEWLLAEGQRCGLVVADTGMGKSHLAAAAARRLGGLGAEVATLSVGDLPEGEWLELLLARLPLDPASRAEPIRPWLKLENRLRENTLMERPTVLVFDDLDRAPADALDGVARLVAAGEPRFASTVVVATATPAGLADVPAAVRRRAVVRIDLPPWGDDDVAGYVAAALARGGVPGDAFSEAAVATIARFAGGVPRTVCRLARLAASAAAGEGLGNVDAATVERAWRELLPDEAPASGASDDLHAASRPTAGRTGAKPPEVKVVRRLWG